MKRSISSIDRFIMLLTAVVLSCTATAQKATFPAPNYATAKDGTSIFYITSEKKDIALVFVHGWTCDHTYWRKQLDHFAKDYQVVALDLAGHGKSGFNRTSYTMESFGGDVATVVQTLKLGRIVLIGHSMGGPVIVEAARQLPKIVMGIVGADTFHNVEAQMTVEEIDRFLQTLRADYSGTVGKMVREGFPPNSDSLLVKEISTHMASARPEVGLNAVRHLFEWKRKTLQGLSIPKWTINAQKNKTNIQAANKYGLQVEEMAGVGHFVMLEDAQTFNRLLLEIVNKLKEG
jgi:pimeloyl-ACP methyl ester carboxylesterase